MAAQTLIEKLRKLALIESHKDEVKKQQHPAWKAAKRLEEAESLLRECGNALPPNEPALISSIEEFLTQG